MAEFEKKKKKIQQRQHQEGWTVYNRQYRYSLKELNQRKKRHKKKKQEKQKKQKKAKSFICVIFST